MEDELIIQMIIFDLETKYEKCPNSLKKYYLWCLIRILKRSIFRKE